MEKVATADFIKQVAKQSNMSQEAVRRVLDQASVAIKEYAWQGKAVSFHGLGTFKPVDLAARVGRNPKTGETVQIPAKRALVFKAIAGGKLG